MSYDKRKGLYDKIEEMRERPLISFVTSLRGNASGQMASDVIPEFTHQLTKIPLDKKKIDILIVSFGGDPTVSWRIISLLRERFQEVGVLLPSVAYSAATLIALGADEIVMHPFSNLGPVDPQLRFVRKVPGAPGQKDLEEVLQFASEDLTHFLDFVESDVGITDQEQKARLFELACKDVGTIPIGISKRSSYLALSMGEKLLALHMKDQNKVKAIAEALNKSFYHHGYPVGRTEAANIGLPVTRPSLELERLLWDVWLDIEEEMQCRRPFSPLEVILGDPQASKVLGPVPQVQIPPNLPPALLEKAYNNILNQIGIVNVPQVDYQLLQATLESNRCRSEFRTRGKISAVRLPDMRISMSDAKVFQGWESIGE